MADNVIEVRMVDGGSQGVPSSPPTNSGTLAPAGGSRGSPQTIGYQRGSPDLTNQILAAILVEVRRVSGGTVGGNSSEENNETKAGGMFGRVGRYAETVLRGVGQLMDVIAMRTQKGIEVATARIRNQEQEAIIAQKEKEGLTKVAAMRAAAEIAGAAPKVSVMGNSVDLGPQLRALGMAAAATQEAAMRLDIKQMQETLGIGQAFRARGQELSRYDGAIGRTFATGEVNRQRRDMGEAQILSSQFSAVEAQQQQLDRLNQQLGILAKMKEADEQRGRVAEEMKERQKELNEKLDALPAEMAKKIRELGDSVKDPIDILEANGGFSGGMRDMDVSRRENDLAARQQAAMLNIPFLQQFGG